MVTRPRGLSADRAERDLDPPPWPAPGVCRWCGGRRVVVSVQHGVCEQGCLDPDVAPYVGRCEDCQVAFRTGSVRRTAQCWRCAHRERQEAEGAEPGAATPGSYTADRIAEGANRRVMHARRSRS